MKKTKVSIIVPIYNVEQYLIRCVDSLVNQTLRDIEILLIDDGSSDNSGKICDELLLQDSRIRVFHKENGGVSSARNLGIENADGDYLGFVDPDDWCDLDMFERMYNAAKENNCDLVICGYIVNNENDKYNLIESPEISGIVSGNEALFQCLRGQGHGCFTAIWNKLIRRECIDDIRFECDYIISEDELFLSTISNNVKKAYVLKDTMYHWYQSQQSAIRSKEKYYEKWNSAFEAKTKIPEIVKDEKCKDLAKANIYGTLFPVIYTLYYFDEQKLREDFLNRILPYKQDFLSNSNYSLRKKLRYEILALLIKMKAPRNLVYKIGTTTMVELKKCLND